MIDSKKVADVEKTAPQRILVAYWRYAITILATLSLISLLAAGIAVLLVLQNPMGDPAEHPIIEALLQASPLVAIAGAVVNLLTLLLNRQSSNPAWTKSMSIAGLIIGLLTFAGIVVFALMVAVAAAQL